MKIGLICPYDVSLGGGVKEVVLALQAELTRRGHDVYIITPEPREISREYANDRHMLFIGRASDLSAPAQHTTVQFSASLNEHIDALLDEYNFDILHFHEPWVPLLSRQIISRSKCLNIATSHAALPEGRMTRAVVRAVTPYARGVLKYIDEYTATSELATQYVKSMGIKNVNIIPIGINLKDYKQKAKLDPKNKHKNIFYIGRLESRKGVTHLISAIAPLVEKHPEVRLTIAGNGPDRKKLIEQVEELGLKRYIKFVGYVSDEQKFDYMRKADLFCSPAIYGEGFGIVLLEAMASGLPTVAGNNPGYAQVMTGIGALSLVNPLDTGQFAHRLELMLYEKDLRRLWRDWAKAEIGQYDYRVITDQYEALYNEVLTRRKRKRQTPQNIRSDRFHKLAKRATSRYSIHKKRSKTEDN